MSEASLLLRAGCKDAASRDDLMKIFAGEGEAPAPWDELPVADEVKARFKKGFSAFFEDTMDEEAAIALVTVLARQDEINSLDACYYDSEGEFIIWRKVGAEAALVCRSGDCYGLDSELAWAPPGKVLSRTAKLAPQGVVINEAATLSATARKSAGPEVIVGLSAGDTAWRPDDPAWLAQREAEWPHVLEARRELTGWPAFNRKYDKIHKELFFTGRLSRTDEQVRAAFDGGLWLFEMGYHPAPSREAFIAIANRHYRRSLNVNDFLQYANKSDLSPEYGLFGGREELIIKTLIPDGIRYFQEHESDAPILLDESLDREPDGLRVLASGVTKNRVLTSCLGGSFRVLFLMGCSNGFQPGRYLWTPFDRLYEEGDVEDRTEKRLRDELLPRLVVIEYSDFFKNRKYPEALAFSRELRKRFEDGGFSSRLMAAWHDTFRRYERGEFADRSYLQTAWERMQAAQSGK